MSLNESRISVSTYGLDGVSTLLNDTPQIQHVAMITAVAIIELASVLISVYLLCLIGTPITSTVLTLTVTAAQHSLPPRIHV